MKDLTRTTLIDFGKQRAKSGAGLATLAIDRIIRFAVTAIMRLEEICNIAREDVDFRNRMVTVRNRKDPWNKDGNNQRIPMLDLTRLRTY